MQSVAKGTEMGVAEIAFWSEPNYGGHCIMVALTVAQRPLEHGWCNNTSKRKCYGFLVVALWFAVGFQMASLRFAYGLPLISLWFPSGFQ